MSPEVLRQEEVEIVDGPLRHLKVLRLRAGDRVALFDGAGTELEVELLEVGHQRARARPCGRIDHPVEATLKVVVVHAVPVRAQRLDPVVRQLTELGVHEFVPLVSRHGRGTGDAVAVRLDRWRRIVDSAAEQCGRRRVMGVADPVAFDEIDWTELWRPLLLLDPEAPTGALDRVAAVPGDVPPSEAPGRVTLLVGPEGGWSADEIAAARDRHGAIPVGLGPRVLRADTAGVVAAAVVLHRWGDLG